VLEVHCDPTEIGPWRQHIVDPADDAHQVRLHVQRPIELGLSDLAQPQTANSEVGVLQWFILGGGDVLGEAVGPAPIGTVLIEVLQALGR
jgi:hypothetical protein